MSEEITFQDYYEGCRSVADEIAEELRNYLKENELETADHWPDYASELVGGHYWMTYYWCQYHVMRHTRNDDALIELFGEDSVAELVRGLTSFADIQSQFAVYAFRQDVEEIYLEDYIEDTGEKNSASYRWKLAQV
mgnify:CR=1 FL=1